MEPIGPSTESSTRLEHYWLMLKRRWIPASGACAIVLALSLLATSSRKPTYLAEGMLRFERSNATSSLTGVGKEISNLEPLAEKSNPLATEAEIIRSTPMLQEVVGRLNLRDGKGAPLKPHAFSEKLKVLEIRGTDILKISYEDADPQKAATVVNTLVDVYMENNILSHRAQAVAARKFIEEQLPKAEAEVSQAEDALRQFKEVNKVVALKEEATATVSVLTDLQKQIAAAQSQIVNTVGEAEVYRDKLGVNPEQAVAIAALSQSSGVQEVLKELQEGEAQLAIEQSRLQADHPKVVSLTEKITFLNQLLQERITKVLGTSSYPSTNNLQMGTLQQDLTKELVILEGNRQGLARQLLSLSQTQAAYRQRANFLPRLEKEQRELERQLEASQSTYSQLLQKMGEVRIAENQNMGNARIVSSAQIPDRPVSSKKIIYLAALLLGFMASGATVYLLEIRDKSIKTVEQAKELFGFTLLGVVPHHEKVKKVGFDDVSPERFLNSFLSKEAPLSSVSAAYRILQANLKFLSSDKALKVIVVSSSTLQEGKSTVAANLAAAMAQLGRQVLLMDADMHHPIQHRIWDLSNEVGLSNVLVEQIASERATKTVMDNLDVLLSGVVPPNSIALLNSQRMAALIQQFSTSYDFVIIDTPPLSSATDALILGKLADGILLVVRPGLVDAGSATFTKGLLTQSGQTVLGMVVNGVIAKNDPHSSYYFINDRYTQAKTDSSEIPRVVAGNPPE